MVISTVWANKYFCCSGSIKYTENKLNENNWTVNVENQEGLENAQQLGKWNNW